MVDSSYTITSSLDGNFHISFNNYRIYPDKFFQYYRMSLLSTNCLV